MQVSLEDEMSLEISRGRFLSLWGKPKKKKKKNKRVAGSRGASERSVRGELEEGGSELTQGDGADGVAATLG